MIAMIIIYLLLPFFYNSIVTATEPATDPLHLVFEEAEGLHRTAEDGIAVVELIQKTLELSHTVGEIAGESEHRGGGDGHLEEDPNHNSASRNHRTDDRYESRDFNDVGEDSRDDRADSRGFREDRLDSRDDRADSRGFREDRLDSRDDRADDSRGFREDRLDSRDDRADSRGFREDRLDSRDHGDDRYNSREPNDDRFDSRDYRDNGHDSRDHRDNGHDSRDHRDNGHDSRDHRDNGHDSRYHRDNGHDSRDHRDNGHDSRDHRDNGHDSRDHRDNGHDSRDHRDNGHDSRDQRGDRYDSRDRDHGDHRENTIINDDGDGRYESRTGRDENRRNSKYDRYDDRDPRGITRDDTYDRGKDDHISKIRRHRGDARLHNDIKVMHAASERTMHKTFPRCESETFHSMQFTQCYWPDSANFMKVMPGYLRFQKCSPPLDGLQRLVDQVVTEGETIVQDRIIQKRLYQCGYTCKFKAACCGNRDEYLEQGFKVEVCNTKPCKIDELSTEERRVFKVNGSCDLGQVGFPDWKSVMKSAQSLGNKFAELNERIFCTSFGTTEPRMNCVKSPDGDRSCICCCNTYTPVIIGNSGKYSCVQNKDPQCDY